MEEERLTVILRVRMTKSMEDALIGLVRKAFRTSRPLKLRGEYLRQLIQRDIDADKQPRQLVDAPVEYPAEGER